MAVFAQLARRFYIALAELNWPALIVMTIAHVAISWLLLLAAGESDLTGHLPTYIYFYVVTATTVGYGDLSPATDLGRMIASFVVVPGAIAIFTAVLGKVLTAIGSFWRMRMNGLGSYAERRDHVLVLGWRDGATQSLMNLVVHERRSDEPLPVLLAVVPESNPFAGTADFVRSDRLADPEALERAGIAGARAVIVRGRNDDETLAASLVAATLNEHAHIVAHFEHERTSAIVERQNRRIEAVTSMSSELLVRSARDPGSSQLARLLLSSATDDTSYSIAVPEDGPALRYGEALSAMRKHFGATLVGLGKAGSVDLNCADDAEIGPGNILYYISDRRLSLTGGDWERLTEAAR